MAEKPSSTSSFMQQQQQQHCCEICGKSSLTDDTMRDHMKTFHIDGNVCPFCGMTGVAPAELLLHVNQAHLDYLTPENELMSFIDDQSPRYESIQQNYAQALTLAHPHFKWHLFITVKFIDFFVYL